MRKSDLFTLFTIILGITALAPVQAQDELVYVAVEPCRIVDTRSSTDGAILSNDFRNFLVSGTAGELASQGASGDCLDPKDGTGQEPLAVAAYVIAVPAPGSGAGVLTAYPSDQQPPPPGTGSTVNFSAGQVIGNTTTITLCDPASCPDDGEFAILARNTDEHVVIDVQGYFYPLSGGDGHVVAGTWEGTGQSIFVDGTTAEITAATAVITQEQGSDFAYGTAELTVNGFPPQLGLISGHLQGNHLMGVMGFCTGPAECTGIATFDGTVSGDELTGTSLGLSDGSVSTLTLQRTSQ